MATHGLSLNRSEGLALAKQARTLAHDIKALVDPKATPSVLIEDHRIVGRRLTALGNREGDAAYHAAQGSCRRWRRVFSM